MIYTCKFLIVILINRTKITSFSEISDSTTVQLEKTEKNDLPEKSTTHEDETTYKTKL